MPNYTLKQLRYFVATVEHGGVAQASRHLNVAQPSISAAIKNLEDDFAVQLFIRRPASGVTLTAIGARFHRHALDLLGHARAFEQNALAENDTVEGQVQLGCYVTIAPLYMPGLLAGFRERHPGVRIHLQDGTQDRLIAGLDSGRFELAMMYDLGLDPSIARLPLLPELRPHAVLPRGHALAGRATVSLRELAAEKLILLDVPPSGAYFRGFFTALDLTPDIAFASPSLEMVRGLVGRGLGYSILVTRPAAATTYDGHEVATIPLSDKLPPSILVIAWHAGARLTKPAQAFVQYCQEAIGGLKPRD
jgi:DNA-binding transcriptional LysR family regulator